VLGALKKVYCIFLIHHDLRSFGCILLFAAVFDSARGAAHVPHCGTFKIVYSPDYRTKPERLSALSIFINSQHNFSRAEVSDAFISLSLVVDPFGHHALRL
jgi:hypothetical protein